MRGRNWKLRCQTNNNEAQPLVALQKPTLDTIVSNRLRDYDLVSGAGVGEFAWERVNVWVGVLPKNGPQITFRNYTPNKSDIEYILAKIGSRFDGTKTGSNLGTFRIFFFAFE